MNGPIAQLVALVCHANAILSGQNTEGFSSTNSTCQFCDKVSFVEVVKPFIGKAREREVADSPDAWFRYYEVPVDVLEDPTQLEPWMRKAIDVAARVKRGRRTKSK